MATLVLFRDAPAFFDVPSPPLHYSMFSDAGNEFRAHCRNIASIVTVCKPRGAEECLYHAKLRHDITMRRANMGEMIARLLANELRSMQWLSMDRSSDLTSEMRQCNFRRPIRALRETWDDIHAHAQYVRLRTWRTIDVDQVSATSSEFAHVDFSTLSDSEADEGAIRFPPLD